MKPHEHFLHLFTPRHTNNHRAKILHPKGLIFCIAFLVVFQIGLSFVHSVSPEVLGYATNINLTDLFNETNARRASNGAGALALNDQLNNAASGKASDMFHDQYWAHTSPSGKEPWAFITGAGYNYVFAGENLARDFGDSHAVVDAWMNSPSHRENLLNPRFKDVGFAIVNGKYGDSETTLVVQMFGAKSGDSQAISAAAATVVEAINTPFPTPVLSASPTPIPSPSPTRFAAAVANTTPPPRSVLPAETVISQPTFDILKISRQVAFILLAVLVVDAILIYSRKTVRIASHNTAHVMILLMVIVAISLLGRGIVL